ATQPNSVCDEDLAANAFTGEIVITLDPYANDPGVDGVADSYTYSITGQNTGFTDSNSTGTFIELEDDTYDVIVTNDDLGCPSDVVPVVVDDIQILPVIAESIQSSTNCSLPDNGELSIVDIDGEANPAVFNTTHTINWYNGNSVVIVAGTRVPDFTGDTYAGIPGDANYTVEVINNATGCNTVETYTLPTSEIDPVVTLNNKNDNAVCNATLATDSPNGFTGFIEVTYSDVNSIPSDTYTISWFTDAAATVDVNTTYPDANIDNSVPGTSRLEFIPGGTYYITVLNDRLGCETSPQQFTIVNLPDPPTPGLVVDAIQTSCGSPNGILRLNDIDGILVGAYPDNIDIDWFVGSDTNTPFNDGVDGAISADELTLTNISSRNYTVQITNLSTGCQDIASILVPEVITKPTVEFVSKTPNNICDIANLTPNGSITVQVNGGIPLPDANYEFTWYAGETPSGTPLTVADANSPLLDEQVEGDYTVTVTDLSTSCVSLPITVEIIKSTTPPTITTSFIQQTSCDFAGNPNGSVSVVIDNPVASSGFSVRWYTGTSVPADIFDDSDPRVLTLLATGVPANGVTAVTSDLPGDLPQGDYTVLVYDEDSGCTVQETVTVTQNVVNPVVSLTPYDHKDCTFDGDIIPVLEQGQDVDYEFIWHQGQTTAGPIVYQVTTSFGDLDVDSDSIAALNQKNVQAFGVLNNLYSDF
ncbi:hypothetical protein, partial [Fulvivirga lutimaris]|uniref:hypothetical protein n=1 Tax=Fulvivirga lutimaris TaxID=1819566 RepID=UPI00162570E1